MQALLYVVPGSPRSPKGVCRERRSDYGRLPLGFTSADLPLSLRREGRRATLRWLQAADAGLLLEFFLSHSEETIYQRYGHWVQMTAEKAAQLVEVDQSRDAALGVFETKAHQQRLIAIGRYCLHQNERSAELAFVVHEQRRRCGLATILLTALVAIARERNLDRLVAQVHHDNAPMLAILRAAGAAIESIPGTGAVVATLALMDDGTSPPRADRPGGSNTTG